VKHISKLHEFYNSADFKNYLLSLTSSYIEGVKGDCYESKESKIVERIVNNLKNIKPITFKGVTIRTYSVFVHGRKYPISWAYNGPEVELSDVVFICQLSISGKERLKKMTFNSFKKDDKHRFESSISKKRCRKSQYSWSIDMNQLYFLANMPKFSFTQGTLSGKVFSPLNISGHLGSYSFLGRDEIMNYLQAPLVRNLIGTSSTLNANYLVPLYAFTNVYACFLSDEFSCNSCLLLYDADRWFKPPESIVFSPNIYYFVRKYLMLLIGEVVFSDVLIDDDMNTLAHNLENIAKGNFKTNDEQKKSKDFLLMDSVDCINAHHKYIDGEGEGGFGIIFTEISIND